MRLWRRATVRRPDTAGASVAWLVVGLGNPGPRYANTRHNLGREAVFRVAERNAVQLDQAKMRARYGLGLVSGLRACLATPTTFMNESGQAVAPLARFYKVPPERVLLAYDDLDLSLGTVRIRPAGGPGGHNGVASVLQAFGTQDVPRVRLGIGRPPDGWDAADYVLGRFSPEDRAVAQAVAVEAAEAIECVLLDGIDAAMNRYN